MVLAQEALLTTSPANQEDCSDLDSSNKRSIRDLKALGKITMQLTKSVKNDGVVGVDDLKRWPADSKVVGFLSALTSGSRLDELLGVSSVYI